MRTDRKSGAGTAKASASDSIPLNGHRGTPDFAVPMSDAWVVLGALAARTERIRLGTTITALLRHQPQAVARQAVSLDRLSAGRMVLGVGLGDPSSEYIAVGRSADRRVLAAMLDEGLEVVAGLWTGQPFSHHGAAVAELAGPAVAAVVTTGWAGGAVTASAIASHLELTTASVTALITRLANAGPVTRAVDRDDRRVVDVASGAAALAAGERKPRYPGNLGPDRWMVVS